MLMRNKPLPELLEELEQELNRLGYTEATLKFYRRRWKMLLDFAKSRGEIYFSEQLGIDFVEKYFNILEKILAKLSLRMILRSCVSSGWWVTSSFTILCYGVITSTRKC